MQLLQDCISACDWISAFLLTSPKVSVPCLWAGCTLQTSLQGMTHPDHLPATLAEQFAQLPQPPAEFYTPFQAHLYQSQSNQYNSPNCVMHSLWEKSRHFLLKFLPVVLIFGKIILPIRDNSKGGGRGQGAPEDLIIFSCHDDDVICKALRTRMVFQ